MLNTAPAFSWRPSKAMALKASPRFSGNPPPPHAAHQDSSKSAEQTPVSPPETSTPQWRRRLGTALGALAGSGVFECALINLPLNFNSSKEYPLETPVAVLLIVTPLIGALSGGWLGHRIGKLLDSLEAATPSKPVSKETAIEPKNP